MMKKYIIVLFVIFTLLILFGCQKKISIYDKRDYITKQCSEGKCSDSFYVKWLDARLQETRCYITTQDNNPNCGKDTNKKWDIVLSGVNCYIEEDTIICDIPK